MNRALRLIAAAMLCGASAIAVADDLSLQQPDGKLVAVIDDGTDGPYAQHVERRHADGQPDLRFGRGGRVAFTLGPGSLGPHALRIDAKGRLLVTGSAFAPGDRSAPATVRFLADGSPDYTWGVRGASLTPAAAGDASGIDVLAMADDTVLLLGQVESPASTLQPALWHLRADGQPDPGFGSAGVLVAGGLGHATPLGLRADDDGAALIALQVQGQGATWLEVHRWTPGMVEPQLVSRQRLPGSWHGTPALDRRDGRWQWIDAGARSGLPLAATAVRATWTRGDVEPAPPMAGTDDSAAASDGKAFFNPFAQAQARTPGAIDAGDGVSPWFAAAAALLGAAMLGVLWRGWRRPEVTDLGLLDTRRVQVDEAIRGIRSAATGASSDPVAVAVAPEAPAVADGECHDTLLAGVAPTGPEPDRGLGGGRVRLPGPSFGEPDDLRRIKGVGPALERLLHDAGVYYYWQIAAWTADDVAFVESRMTSFRGRIGRDAWIAQATRLASGPGAAAAPLVP
ncbi:MAG: hypothetical protein OEW27_15160 [Aquincola sp.]|nr:hypothetical protein [Aquincola sp.]